jgi:predicted nucleotidyltransferase
MYIRIPIQKIATERIFKWNYTRDLLLFLAKNPYKSFMVSEIIENLDIRSRDSLTKLLNALKEADLIETVRIGRKRFVSINKNLIEMPEDPIFQIPQDEYRIVVKTIVDAILEFKGIDAIILFGAVARGNADRMSDIDIMVIGKDATFLQEKASEIAYGCRSGKIFPERFEVNIRVISEEELKTPRGYIKDALNEGIILYGDRNDR